MAMKPIGKASIEIVAKGLEQVTQQLEALRVAVSRLTSDTERDVNKATKAAEDGYKKQEKAAEKAAESVEKLAAKQADAAKKAEEIGKAGRTGFGALDDAVGKAGQKIEDSTAGLRRFQGAITGIIGVVGGFASVGVGLFKKIAGEIKEAEDAAKDVKEALDDLKNAGKDAIEIIDGFGRSQDALQRLDSELEQQKRRIIQNSKDAAEAAEKAFRESNPYAPFVTEAEKREFTRELENIEKNRRDALEALSKKAAEREKAIRQQLAEEAYRQEEDRLNAIGSARDEVERQTVERARELRLSMLSDVERAEEELARTQADLREQIAFAGGDERRIEQLREILRLETQIGQQKVKSAKEAAEASASGALVKEMQELRRSMADQAKAINENTREVRGLRERVFNFTPDIRRVAENTSRRTR